MKMKRPRRIKKEYIPVIIAVLILFILIAALVFVIFYKDPNKYKKVEDVEYKQEELVVNNENSKCSSTELEELYNLAKKVKLERKETKISMGKSIAVDEPDTPEVEIFATVFDITLKNMSNDLYLYVTNDYNADKVEIVDPENNVFKFQTKYATKVVTYTVELRSYKYKCIDEAIRKFTVVTPIYNVFSDMYVCNTYPEFKYCKEFIYEDVPSYPQFFKELEKYQIETGKTTTMPTQATSEKTTKENKE